MDRHPPSRRSPLVGHATSRISMLSLSAADTIAVEEHAKALDTRLFGSTVKQSLEEQAAEIRSTMQRIFSKDPD